MLFNSRFPVIVTSEIDIVSNFDYSTPVEHGEVIFPAF